MLRTMFGLYLTTKLFYICNLQLSVNSIQSVLLFGSTSLSIPSDRTVFKSKTDLHCMHYICIYSFVHRCQICHVFCIVIVTKSEMCAFPKRNSIILLGKAFSFYRAYQYAPNLSNLFMATRNKQFIIIHMNSGLSINSKIIGKRHDGSLHWR